MKSESASEMNTRAWAFEGEKREDRDDPDGCTGARHYGRASEAGWRGSHRGDARAGKKMERQAPTQPAYRTRYRTRARNRATAAERRAASTLSTLLDEPMELQPVHTPEREMRALSKYEFVYRGSACDCYYGNPSTVAVPTTATTGILVPVVVPTTATTGILVPVVVPTTATTTTGIVVAVPTTVPELRGCSALPIGTS